MTLSTPKSPLTSARMFDKTNTENLAYWLDEDARRLDGTPGNNNHVAATRSAVERLLSGWRALGLIDQTMYANADSPDDLSWTNAEVLAMLQAVRDAMTTSGE